MISHFEKGKKIKHNSKVSFCVMWDLEKNIVTFSLNCLEHMDGIIEEINDDHNK